MANVDLTHVFDADPLEYHRLLLRAAAARVEAARASLAEVESSIERDTAEREIASARNEVEHHRAQLDQLNPRRGYA